MWDYVFTAVWQWCLNPYSKQSLTEHTVHGEVTPDWNLLSQILDQDKQGGTLDRGTVPASVARLVYILEDSIVGPQNHMTTFTGNINHTHLMVQRNDIFPVSSENSCWTATHRKPWSPLAFLASPELSRNLVLTTSKEIVIKAMKGFEYILAKLQGRDCFNTLVETTEEAKEKENKGKDTGNCRRGQEPGQQGYHQAARAAVTVHASHRSERLCALPLLPIGFYH